LIFVGEPDLGVVDAISTSTLKIVARLSVPGARALSLDSNSQRLLVSTGTQEVAWIDTNLLRVIAWDILPKVTDPIAGSEFVASYQCVVLSSGKILFSAVDSSFVSGSSLDLVEWDFIQNAATIRKDGPGGLAPMAASANGAKVVFAAGPTIFDSASDTFSTSSAFGSVSFAAANPTGTQFALLTGSTVTLIDSRFKMLGQVALGGLVLRPNGLVYSGDGKFVYVVSPGNLPLISVIDAQTFSLIGEAPAVFGGTPQFDYNVSTPYAADTTGLVFGGMVGGLAADDANNIQTFSSSQAAPSGAFLLTPTEGPLAGGTKSTITTSIFSIIPDVWFGPLRASAVGLNSIGQLQVTAPAMPSSGPVNVKVLQPDGIMGFIPQAFTYGAVAVSFAPFAASPNGGIQADIWGFGFSADVNSSSRKVTIAGNNASIVSATQAGGIPRQRLTVTVPPGVPGSADIVVNSSSGKATLTRGFHYLNSVTDYATSDNLRNVLYDQSRQQLYLTAGDHLDVFSLTNKRFAGQIRIPSLGGTRQLTGMALTPDYSRLLVGNFSDDSVAVIDPGNPAAAVAVQIAPPPQPGHYALAPFTIACTNNNTAFVNVSTTSATGAGGALYELDLSTLKAKQRNDPALFALQIAGNPMAASKDGSTIFLAVPDVSAGTVMSWSSSTDVWQSHNLGGPMFLFYSDATASGDGNVFALSNDISVSDFVYPMFVDSQLNFVSQMGVESSLATANLQGMALHDSGSLLYSSTPLGIDLIDVHHGQVVE
jgi:DNA-binding beta-propeller fold protein YncE